MYRVGPSEVNAIIPYLLASERLRFFGLTSIFRVSLDYSLNLIAVTEINDSRHY